MLRRGGFAKWGVIILVAGLVAGANATDPPFNLPPIRAVPGTDGGQIVCYGYECADLLESFVPLLPPIGTDVISIGDQSGVDRDQFCAALNNQKPSSCSASNPPSTPDTDPSWQPNGCGSSKFVQAVMSIGIMALVPDDFEGNYNAPYSGISFQASCNTHDRCCGVGTNKETCDENFRSDMFAACSVVTSSAGQNQCNGLAGIYHGAVASTVFGRDAYESSSKDHVCAIWAKNMNENGCKQ